MSYQSAMIQYGKYKEFSGGSFCKKYLKLYSYFIYCLYISYIYTSSIHPEACTLPLRWPDRIQLSHLLVTHYMYMHLTYIV